MSAFKLKKNGFTFDDGIGCKNVDMGRF